MRTYPSDGGAPGDAPLEERLKGRILAIMRLVIDRRVNIGQAVVSSLNAPNLFLIAKDLTRAKTKASATP